MRKIYNHDLKAHMFKTLKRKTMYQDAWLKLYQDEIEFPDGSTGTYAWVDRKSGAAVVVVTKDKKILLHKEYRYPIHTYSWEIQGGGIDAGETPAQAAVRELQEEAGITVSEDQLISLGTYYPVHSFSTEKGNLFMVVLESEELAEITTEASEHLEEHKFFSFDEVNQMIDTGKINDAGTGFAVQLAMRRVEQHVAGKDKG